MDLRKLEAFQEVMLTGSVTEAARNMGRTQPAVSNLIAGLENSVGYKLFERRGGRLHPVPEAHFLLAEARIILEQVRGLRLTMQGMGALEEGHLRIASMPIHAEYLMPQIISRFVKNRDGVTISLVSQSSPRVYERLASQQFDIGFAEVTTESPLVDADEIAMDCMCAVPAGDPLARKSEITPAEIEGRPMACFLSQHFIRQRLHEIFESEGRRFFVRFETQNAASQYHFIEQGLAYGVMSPLSAHNYRTTRADSDGIVFIPFKPKVSYRVAILTPAHKPLSRLALAFIDMLKAEVASILAERAAARDNPLRAG
jgi:DNA-binding transcriptional LysR family regulator